VIRPSNLALPEQADDRKNMGVAMFLARRKTRRQVHRKKNPRLLFGEFSPGPLHVRWLRPCLEPLEDRRLLTSTPFNQIATDLSNVLTDAHSGVQAQLTNVLNAYNGTGANSSIPFVGDKLGTAAQIVDRFSTSLQNALAAIGNTDFSDSGALDSAIKNALGPALGSGGLHILVGQNG
jgi:hypothetical protein